MIKRLKDWSRLGASLVLLLATAGLTACDVDEFFDVENPGRILDEDLFTDQGLGTLVTGASAELSDYIDTHVFMVVRVTDELAGSGSYYDTGLQRRGLLHPIDTDGYWEQPQEGRWAAETAIERIEQVRGPEEAADDSIYARAYLLAGVSNNHLAENMCDLAYGVSERLPRDTAFSRALNQFERAEQLANTSGAESLRLGAIAGQAQALVGMAWSGRASWSDAAAKAAQVPTDYKYVAFYHFGENENIMWNETHERHEVSAWATPVQYLPEDNPRAPYTDCRVGNRCDNDIGADGQTPMLRQEKYDDRGSDITILSGVEARMIQAEAALIAGNLGEFVGYLNDVREYFGIEEELAAPANQQEGFDMLASEKFLNMWLEGNRLWDIHRWDTDDYTFTMYEGSSVRDFLYGGTVIYETDATRRASCVPIGFTECQANPNITCSTTIQY